MKMIIEPHEPMSKYPPETILSKVCVKTLIAKRNEKFEPPGSKFGAID